MTSVGLALCVLMSANVGGAPSTSHTLTAAKSVQGRVTSERLPNGLYSLRYTPKPASGLSSSNGALLRVASLDRARFFEETDKMVYYENRKNAIHAFGLALLPNLFYKPLAIGIAWKYCDKGEDDDKKFLAFLTAVPGAGLGSFYSEWTWSGAIAMAGDLAGSVLMSWYFYDEHATRNDPGGSMTKFYAGLGVAAFFWVFDMVMAPVGAMYFNSKLRERYMQEQKTPKKRTYHTPPTPDTGVAHIGPQPTQRQPVAIGYSGTF